MKLNIHKVARLSVLALLLFGLAFIFSNHSASQAAATRNSQPSKPEQLAAANAFFQGNSLSTSFLQQDPPGVDPALLRRLKQNARGQVSVSELKSTGMARFVRVSRDGDLLPASQEHVPQGKAKGFFSQYGGLFGVRDANRELTLASAALDQQGATHLTYLQMYNGVPVFAGVLRVHMDAKGKMTAINGAFVPDISLDTVPAVTMDEAASRAMGDVQANPPSDNEMTGAPAPQASAGLAVESNTLYVYRDGLIQDIPGTNMLVYEVVVTDGASLREVVFVNAHTGKIVNRYSATQDALFRRLFEQSTSTQVWQEGDPFPGSLNGDQQNIVNFSGDAYYHFFNAFGRDSYDGAGHEMQSVNNDPRISCPNANWNGLTTNYCNGVTADDVVAHEWGHAYTEYTDNLIYQWQSGALNEAYSDIWGEVVDMLNGAGTDSPAPVRSVGVCSAYTTPVPVLTINSPASLAGDYAAAGAAFGPLLTQAGTTGNVVVADDGAGVPTDACQPLVNGAAVSGNIALVDRGSCTFVVKVKNAQNAGATAVIVANNVVGAPATMGGADPTIVIPSVMVTKGTGDLIKAQPAGSVNATLKVTGGAVEDSYRWLMGEDATAFGGAIRDMYNPTCLADPGKVSDSQYFCAATDGGGVHTNSGVINHGFSLLVDGGNYNGQTITGIGAIKAAHIYWRAQSVYQTPTTDFNDHADSLQAACQDLIGQSLDALGTGTSDPGTSSEVITSADCAQVDNMIQAVELRLDPSAQCNFQPILKPNPPAVCAAGTTPTTLYKEEFKNLNKWTLTNQGVFSGWPGLNWAKDSSLPGGRSGSAAFAIDPNAGNCDGGAGDISGMMSLESEPIRIAAGVGVVPRLVFQHYIASEAGFDGGNLKISINGGPYQPVPTSAFVFNPYNTTLQPTDPLAGQPAFSGTDGGKLFGSWGESQIDLGAVGVRIGDKIRLRFDFGMDGCAGNDGWYVDNVELIACKP